MSNKKVRFGWAMSSQNPEQVSLTIKGVGGAVVTLLLLFAPHFGLDLSVIDFNALISAISNAVVSTMAVCSSLAIVWGGLRKVYYALLKKSE